MLKAKLISNHKYLLPKLLFSLFFLTLSQKGFCQYWQQQVDYSINVSLNASEKSIDGFETLQYHNNSPDTLSFIWIHLWPNAYKNDRTAFSDQLLKNGSTRFYFSNKNERGYINRIDFKVDGITAMTEDHPAYIDVVKLLLPKPLPPGTEATITTPFHVKLPFNFSRGGYDGNSFQITQWYPKPAVYDKNGWHPMPYLDQGEFYSEFGNYEVKITVPQTYKVAATGRLQNQNENNLPEKQDSILSLQPVKPAVTKGKSVRKPANHQKKGPKSLPTIPGKTLVFTQDNSHDFAWFASTEYQINSDTCKLASGKIIEVTSYYTPSESQTWKNSLHYIKRAVRFYSDQIGEYPYHTVRVVQGPKSFGGGMEYPTITVISPTETEQELDLTIAHEIGHNWLYGILATNERDHPWMDEGINTFYEQVYTRLYYGDQPQTEELLFQTKARNRTDQPIETAAADLTVSNYGLVAYHKTAQWMKAIQSRAGETDFRNAMQSYFQEWKFRHPQPQDLKHFLAQALKNDTAALFGDLTTTGILQANQLKGFKVVSTIKPETIDSYLKYPVKQLVFLSPAIGINSYDRFMIGGLISNYKLPPSRFQFLLIPLYATGTKQLNGLGKVNYSFSGKRGIRKTDLFVNAATFSMNEFTPSSGPKLYFSFQKLVPGFRLTFKEKEPSETIRKYIQWKTFLIREDNLNISQDTVFTGSDTTLVYKYRKSKQERYLNQLQFRIENLRALYPFEVQLQVEQASQFIRPVLTGSYFFNYPSNGGLSVRIFAGKFFYLQGKTIRKEFETDRYHLNLSGANGYEDYTYSDYFFGRNKFEGWASQQLMLRDGGFKVRTELLASKVGKTDNWLASINLKSSVPKSINPLSVLPFTIPLHVFMDIGTYAEAWNKNAEGDRFLFDAGLQLSLFKDRINIYAPLFYSSVFRDYFKSTISTNRFLKTISFSINLYSADLKQLNHELEF